MSLKIGAGLLDPKGRWHPCRFAEHEDKAYILFRDEYPDEFDERKKTQGFINGLTLLCNRGWVRIGNTGHVTNAAWDIMSPDTLTQAQLNVVYDLLAEARKQLDDSPKNSSLQEYIEGLMVSLQIDPYTLD